MDACMNSCRASDEDEDLSLCELNLVPVALRVPSAECVESEGHREAAFCIQWMNRKGELSNPRWVFLKCCGSLGHVDRSSSSGPVVRSALRCPAPENTHGVYHPGRLVLTARNMTRTQARKKGGDIATWSCCDSPALPSWEAAWDGVGSVPLHIFRRLQYSPGCTPVGTPVPGEDIVSPSRGVSRIMAYGGAFSGSSQFADEARPRLKPSPPTPVVSTAPTAGASSAFAYRTATAAVPAQAAPVKVIAKPAGTSAAPVEETWLGLLRATFAHASVFPAAAASSPSKPDGVSLLSTAAPPPIAPDAILAERLKDVFGLSLRDAAPALWIRGAGGDGRAEALAARGDRMLEFILVERSMARGASAHEATLAVQRYASNAALACVARWLGVERTLQPQGSWHASGVGPSSHVLGTVVEALLAVCWDAHRERADGAVGRLIEIIATEHVDASCVGGRGSAPQGPLKGCSAVETLVRLSIANRLPVPIFIVSPVTSVEGSPRPASTASGSSGAGGPKAYTAAVYLSASGCSAQECVLSDGPVSVSPTEAAEAAAKKLLERARGR